MALFARAAKLGLGPTARGTLGLSRPTCGVLALLTYIFLLTYKKVIIFCRIIYTPKKGVKIEH